MSYNKTSVIQLRELSGVGISNDENYVNGQFEVLIDEETTINDGDEVSIKSCIVDSASLEEGKVEILDSEQNFSITFNHYIKNYEADNKRYNRGIGITSPNQPDGLHYFLCDGADAMPNTKKIETISLTRYGSVVKGYWGKCSIIFNYVPAGQTTASPLSYYTLTLGKLHNRDPNLVVRNPEAHLGFNYNANFPFQYDIDKNDSDQLMDFNNVDITQIGHTGNDQDLGSQRSPHDFTMDFFIPKGTYDPDELARIMTDKLTTIRHDESNFSGANPMLNPMLTTNTQFQADFPHACPDGKAEYCSETGQNFFDIVNSGNANSNVLSGTSQFGIQFDTLVNKFKIVIINNPYYESGNISVKSIKRGADDVYYLVNKTSGITMKAMSPPNVWFKKMGFNPNILLSSSGTITKDFGTGLTNQTQPVFTGIIEGVNTTGSYKGLDMVVVKNGATAGNPNGAYCPPSADINTSTIAQNIIFAENSLATLSLAYGYFLIDVSMGIEQEFKGAINKNSIQAVVGRYYSTNSFTTAYNEGSIPYIHRGDPIKLSKFKVRVLNDIGENSDDIGNNNTIFLEISKNHTPPNPTSVVNMPLQDFLQLKQNQKK